MKPLLNVWYFYTEANATFIFIVLLEEMEAKCFYNYLSSLYPFVTKLY